MKNRTGITVVLKDVLGMVGVQQPQLETAGRTAETARMTNTQVGVCPVCSRTMPVVDAAGIDAYVCEEDNICLPTQDN